MDIHQDIIQWVREMGYNGQIPDSLVGICNNSTKHIWEQLLENIRPKQEVQTIKRNIILDRLKKKPLSKQDDFVPRMKEIEEYKRKISVEGKLKVMDEIIEDKRYKVDQLSQKCKMKDISIDLLKSKIKETEQRKYILEAKKQQLELQNLQAEETLKKLKNVTPVEREESSTAKEITETLEKCAEKLNQILKENQKSIAQKFHKTTGPFTIVKKKSRHDESSVAMYLSIQEKENFEEITRSCKKQIEEKENVCLNIPRHDHDKVKHRLFNKGEIVIEETGKNSSDTSGVCLLSDNENVNMLNKSGTPKPKTRESLGILPDSCLNEVNNDSFLEIIESASCERESASQQSQISVFLSDTERYQRSGGSDESVVFNFKVPEKLTTKTSANNRECFKTELSCHDIGVNRELEILLHGNNRELIYEMLQNCIQNVKVEFTKMCTVPCMINERKSKVNEDDVSKLRFIHIQTELKILQQKRVLKDLIGEISNRKLHLLNSIKSKEYFIDMQDWLEVNIKQLGLDATLAAIKKEINSAKVVENDDNDLQILSSRITKIKNEIANKMELIRLTMEDLYNTQRQIAQTRELVLGPLWHIGMFKTDSSWMNSLLENRWTEEMLVFDKFPLEYQRRCVYTDPKTFYRDMCVDNYPEDTSLDPDDLQMICEILESPFSPPETILLNVIKAKKKMSVLKSIRNSSQNDRFNLQNIEKYSFDDLQRQESYLDFAMDRLKSLMLSSNASRTLSVGAVVTQAMDIWTEMPMKEFISDKRLFEGQNYQYYQKKLNCFL